jgi:hypothetical protein
MKAKNSSPVILDKSFFLSGLIAIVFSLAFWYGVYKLVKLLIS